MTDASPIAITGLGIVSSLSHQDVFKNPELFLGSHGLRLYSREMKLLVAAIQLALIDAGIQFPVQNSESVALVVSANMGNLSNRIAFINDLMKNTPRFVNPAQFPYVLGGSPASEAAIRFGIQGQCITIASGNASVWNAFIYALQLFRNPSIQTVLVGGYESVIGIRNDDLGSAILVLERKETAQTRQAVSQGDFPSFDTLQNMTKKNVNEQNTLFAVIQTVLPHVC